MKSARKFARKTARSLILTRSMCRPRDLKKDGKQNKASPSISSSHTDDEHKNPSLPTFENGVIIRDIGDLVEKEQAVESLEAALSLIKEAKNENGTWVDARDLLDETAAALDDAGLALRKNTGCSVEARILKLADKVVNKRQRLLGGSFVHDADGIWTKSVYGECNGLSFGAENDQLCRIPDEKKEEKALIIYASQTGKSKMFATSLSESLGGETCCDIKNMRNTGIKDLAMHKRVYIICSTFGFGRPPRDGEVFYSIAQLEAMRCTVNIEDLSIDDEEIEKPLAGTSVAIAALGSSLFANGSFAKFGLGLTNELVSLGASIALKTITIDAKNGESEQAQTFQQWERKIIEMEKERLMEKENPNFTTTKRRSSKVIPAAEANSSIRSRV